MLLLQSHSRFLLEALLNRVQNVDKATEVDYHWVEFDDVRYHVQVTMKNPHIVLLSVSLPVPPPETIFIGGLPFGAIEAIKAAYGNVVQILDPPRDGFNLTLKLNLSKLPPNEENKHALLVKIASVREVVLGAPLRVVLKHLASKTVASDIDQLLALVHRPKESFFLIPQAEKVTVVFPMRFNDSIDTVLATSFLQEFVEARRTAGLNNAPLCMWSSSPPLELKGVPSETLSANAGFVTFVIFPRHVEGKKLDRTVWNLSTFHAYVSYHVKCSEGFMHTRMRRRVESMIRTLDRAKPDAEKLKKSTSNKSFKRLMQLNCTNVMELDGWATTSPSDTRIKKFLITVGVIQLGPGQIGVNPSPSTRMKQSKDPFEAALEESPGDSPDELEIETQPQTGTAAGSATAAVTGELEDEFDNLESQAPMSVSAGPAAKMTMSKNKDEYDEEDDENVDVELGKFPSSSDPAKMAKMQAILNQFTEDQMNRYESFRRSALQKSNMRRLLVSITGSQKISLPMTIVVCGIAKMFVGELVETARMVMTERNESGPIRPCHIREAYRRLKLEGKVPKRSVPRLFR
ncbi:actin-related protein 2/3 complex subunit 2A [Citrus sinensis]|uniref:Actin-related protein 2/3 complex subunit 2A n=1 Tax=Citrus sinensis TaxID=2711 RepID=A0ACB8NB23_CITSI|nr:actin-related protein 2/3 complex subunit 2A [Citrus sinensis]KAH9795363.1 actin-related protein 2/3 complex subunit 2A [Citrus sinensis]